MRLLTMLEDHDVVPRQINQTSRHKLRVGMSSYDIALDEADNRVHMGVQQNGLSIAEMIYEDGEVVWIHAEPFFRKQGIGTAMVGFLQEKNYRVVMPEVRTTDGITFFNRLLETSGIDKDLTP